MNPLLILFSFIGITLITPPISTAGKKKAPASETGEIFQRISQQTSDSDRQPQSSSRQQERCLELPIPLLLQERDMIEGLLSTENPDDRTLFDRILTREDPGPWVTLLAAEHARTLGLVPWRHLPFGEQQTLVHRAKEEWENIFHQPEIFANPLREILKILQRRTEATRRLHEMLKLERLYLSLGAEPKALPPASFQEREEAKIEADSEEEVSAVAEKTSKEGEGSSPARKKKKKKKRKKRSQLASGSNSEGAPSSSSPNELRWWNYLEFKSPFYETPIRTFPENLSSLSLYQRLELRDPSAFEQMASEVEEAACNELFPSWNPGLPWRLLALSYNWMNDQKGSTITVVFSSESRRNLVLENGKYGPPKQEQDFLVRFERLFGKLPLSVGYMTQEIDLLEVLKYLFFEKFCIWVPLVNFIEAKQSKFTERLRTIQWGSHFRELTEKFHNLHRFLFQVSHNDFIIGGDPDLKFQLARYYLKALRFIGTEGKSFHECHFDWIRYIDVKTDLEGNPLTPQTRVQKAYESQVKYDPSQARCQLLSHKGIIPVDRETPFPNFWERWVFVKPFLERENRWEVILGLFEDSLIDCNDGIKALQKQFWAKNPKVLPLAARLIKSGIVCPSLQHPAPTFQALLSWAAREAQQLSAADKNRLLFDLYQLGLNQSPETLQEDSPSGRILTRKEQLDQARTCFDALGPERLITDEEQYIQFMMRTDYEVEAEYFESELIQKIGRFLIASLNQPGPIISTNERFYYLMGLVNKTFLRDPYTFRRFEPESGEDQRRLYFNRWVPSNLDNVDHMILRMRGLKSFLETDLDALKEELDEGKQARLIHNIKLFGEEILRIVQEGEEGPSVFLTVGVRVRQILNDLRKTYPQHFPQKVVEVSADQPTIASSVQEQVLSEEEFSSSGEEESEGSSGLQSDLTERASSSSAPPPIRRAVEEREEPSGSKDTRLLRTSSQKERDKLARHREKLGCLLSQRPQTRESERMEQGLSCFSNPRFIWSKNARQALLSDRTPLNLPHKINQCLGAVLNNTFPQGTRPERLRQTYPYEGKALPVFSLRLSDKHRLCYSPLKQGDEKAWLIHQCIGHYDD